VAAPQHTWVNVAAIDAHATGFASLGFTDAATYTVDSLPVAIRFFLKDSDRMYATIYEHPKAGVWINIVILFEDGTSITFTNTQDRGLEKRLGHPIVYSAGASAAQLHAIALARCPSGERKPLSPSLIVSEFEKVWADGVRWRKERGGISRMEAASLILSRGAEPTRILRPTRVEYLREQDGPSERTFKSELCKLFEKDSGIEKAYLATVRYDESPETPVALCLVSNTNDLKVIEDIRRVFKNLFKPNQHLDILRIQPTEVSRIEQNCPPFYISRSLSK
jgi:hypothetical protein